MTHRVVQSIGWKYWFEQPPLDARTIERCEQMAQLFLTGDHLADARLWLAIDAIRALKDET
jgi:hypothetical protein